MHCIYKFVCPVENKVLYIGRSKNFNQRVKSHTKHLKSGKYIRNPFKCKLQSLYALGVSIEKIIKSFEIIELVETECEASKLESHYINEVYGIKNLLNINPNTAGGDDVFTHNPNKEQIREKLKGRIPWNKGLNASEMWDDEVKNKIAKSWFKVGPKLVYKLTSPSGEVFFLTGQLELKQFCNEWKKKHNAISVKDPNWISPTAFKMSGKGNSSLKGWAVDKVELLTDI